MNIALIDSGAGNLKSVTNFFLRNFDCTLNIFKKPSFDINKSDVLILPGVGHFGHVSRYIKLEKLDKTIIDFASTGKPLLGICLGAQLLTNSSEEDSTEKGLSLLDADCLSLKKHYRYKGNIPRIGWTSLQNNPEDSYYFVHSYYMHPNQKNMKATYCIDGVTAMIRNQNICGMQFHPEKSNISGKKIVVDFLREYV